MSGEEKRETEECLHVVRETRNKRNLVRGGGAQISIISPWLQKQHPRCARWNECVRSFIRHWYGSWKDKNGTLIWYQKFQLSYCVCGFFFFFNFTHQYFDVLGKSPGEHPPPHPCYHWLPLKYLHPFFVWVVANTIRRDRRYLYR